MSVRLVYVCDLSPCHPYSSARRFITNTLTLKFALQTWSNNAWFLFVYFQRKADGFESRDARKRDLPDSRISARNNRRTSAVRLSLLRTNLQNHVRKTATWETPWRTCVQVPYVWEIVSNSKLVKATFESAYALGYTVMRLFRLKGFFLGGILLGKRFSYAKYWQFFVWSTLVLILVQLEQRKSYVLKICCSM